MAGSCFSEHISEKMLQNGFHVQSNPWGILFNPISLARMTDQLIDTTNISDSILPIKRDDYWYSLHQHSQIFGSSEDELRANITQLTLQASEKFKDAETYVVTFGSAFVYEYKDKEDTIVANCHKISNTLFTKRLLEIDEIVGIWSELILQMLEKKIIFTVSPVRHSKDGLMENNMSKSILILAIRELLKLFPNQCFYFPSYEIVVDELRDYRFYKNDLVHPNEMAVNYVWEKWCECFYDLKTLEISKAFHLVYLFAQHRTKDRDNSAYVSKLTELKLSLQNRFDYLNYAILNI